MICEVDEFDNVEESFSPVPDFTMVRLVLLIEMQREWYNKNFNFQNEISNNKLSQLAYVELPLRIYKQEKRRTRVMMLSRMLYGLWDEA